MGSALFPKVLLRALDLKLTASVNFDLLAVIGIEKDFYYLKTKTKTKKHTLSRSVAMPRLVFIFFLIIWG